MYVQHPYKFEGKYYAKIDGVFYEISKEVAMAMFADYRNEIYRSRKWAPDYVPSVLTAMDFLLPIWQMTHSSALKN